jgi:ATP-dependent Clp protease ATP-binding subunit ClpA
MSTWLENLKTNFKNKEVVIVHGNVRDIYFEQKTSLIYNNLTNLFQTIAKTPAYQFRRLLIYDPVSPERETDLKNNTTSENKVVEAEQKLAKWTATYLTNDQENSLAIVYYLDKLVAYNQSGYSDAEMKIILRLEKLIENITPNNRLVLVALRDTMIPVELYTSSPKVAVLPIPVPDKIDRDAFLLRKLGIEYKNLDLLGGLSDGLFLKDLDNIIKSIPVEAGKIKQLSSVEIRQLINKYRIGDQEDQWQKLNYEKLAAAKEWFISTEGVGGQDNAIQKVVDVMAIAKAGLAGLASGNTSKPKGVLFFAGPSGVGKTTIAKKLAKFLFGSEDNFIRFDMSEFADAHTESKLIGSPPGYVGYEKGGMLTGAVKEKPFSVVLFDEIEKAHPRIMDIFLQLIDEGRLTDSRGQTVFFTETVIIFTSNIGTRTKDNQGHENVLTNEIDGVKVEGTESEILTQIRKLEGISPEKKSEMIQKHFIWAVRNYFAQEISRPELLNRIGNDIIPFNFINEPKIQKTIIMSHCRRIKDDFEDVKKNSGFKLEYTPNLADFLINMYKNDISDSGGREITTVIKDTIIKPLAIPVLEAEDRGMTNIRFMVDVINNKIVVNASEQVN